MNNKRYNHLNEYFKQKYGERTLKICINGGFTCPNRDGSKSYAGCIFCSEHGSGEHLSQNADISNQVINYFNSYKAARANKFIAYFQNFTNTYDTISNLKSKYDSALIDKRIVALAVATRPDCITEDIAKLLASYKDKVDVWVELGLQTANDNIGDLINRKYTSNDFSKAVDILNKYNIEIVTHVMIGLPKETDTDIESTIDFINSQKINGIKIHSTYIIKNTVLYDMYINKQYIPLDLDKYIKTTAYIITHINPNIIIHKLSGDAPKDLLVAPEWNCHKKWILNGIDKYLNENNLYQGMYYKNK